MEAAEFSQFAEGTQTGYWTWKSYQPERLPDVLAESSRDGFLAQEGKLAEGGSILFGISKDN